MTPQGQSTYYTDAAPVWTVNFGDDVGLPNICDRNCAGCYNDYAPKNTNLTTSLPDERTQLYKRLGENWFPDDWKFQPQWKEDIKNYFKDSKARKYFLFTGRGDPLFYMPCIKEYMKIYKEFKYKGYGVIQTSASLLTQERLNSLIEWNINEIIFNPVATNFNPKTLAKMEMAQHKLNIAVQIPLLDIYEKQLINHLSFLNSINLKYLMLTTARIFSKSGAEKLKKALPKPTKVKKLSEYEAIIENQPMLDRIIKEIKIKNYNIVVVSD